MSAAENLEEYKISYIDKASKVIHRARKVCEGRYVLLNMVTGEKEQLSKHKLQKNFQVHKESLNDFRKEKLNKLRKVTK